MTIVRAAGGLLVARGEVLLVHRPKHGDWSIPKGKLDPGESYEQAAIREVEEETGVTGRLLDELEPQHYTDRRGRAKLVRFWRMAVVSDRGRQQDDEVDALRWLDGPAAVALATWERDRALLRAALDLP